MTANREAERRRELFDRMLPSWSEALASAVRERRTALGLSQQDLRDASGLSVTTISKIERGEGAVQPATLRRLDAALAWSPGTAESWLEGRGGLVPDAPDDDVSEADLVAAILPDVLRALDERRGSGFQVRTNLARLPAPVREAVETLIASLAAHYDPSGL